ncbi:MAG: hypothetical protein GC161_13300 [Planctomycetaceae bacterium]|nr:hypothetical protein [Planctomycetaceae bacterium]
MFPAAREGRDLVWAGVLGALALLVYLVLGQERGYGDGTGLVGFAHLGGGELYHHVLYLPLARFFTGVLPAGADVLLGPRLASQLPAALGVAGTFLLLRALGLGRLAGGLGAGLVALAPCWLFFATTVEVHALHGGVAPWVFLAVLRAPWKRPAVAFAVAVCGLAVLYGTHQTGALLGLVLVLLAGRGAADAGRPLGRVRQWLVLAPALALALAGVIAMASWFRFGAIDPLRELFEAQDLTEGARLGVQLSPLSRTTTALLSLGLLAPLAFLGLLRPPRGALALAAATAGLGGFAVVAWGVVERGGYFLAYLPFLAWPAAAALERLHARFLRWAPALVAAQGALALVPLLEFDQGLRLGDRRLALEEALGPGEPRGELVTLASLAPPPALWWPGVREHALGFGLIEAARGGASPRDAAAAAGALDVLLGLGTVVVDATLDTSPQLVPSPAIAPYFDAIYGEIERRFVVASVERGGWVFWRIEGRRTTGDAQD